MLADKQHTLSRRVEFSGVALHSGKTAHVELLPAGINAGVVFKRVDLPGTPLIPAHINNVVSTELNTTIGSGDARVSTIEHLMAAFAGLGVDNVLVKIDGPEVPIMDGSAAAFVELILQAGLSALPAQRRHLVVREAFEYKVGNKWIRVEPSEVSEYKMDIDFDTKVIGSQTFGLSLDRNSFMEIALSRTFCHIRDIDLMRQAGLALGGSLENAVVVSDDGVLNPDGLRHADEFVRHKLLDCLGDLYLLGGPIIGKICASKSGHGLHAGFMRELWAHRGRYLTIVEDLGVRRDLNNQTATAAGALA